MSGQAGLSGSGSSRAGSTGTGSPASQPTVHGPVGTIISPPISSLSLPSSEALHRQNSNGDVNGDYGDVEETIRNGTYSAASQLSSSSDAAAAVAVGSNVSSVRDGSVQLVRREDGEEARGGGLGNRDAELSSLRWSNVNAISSANAAETVRGSAVANSANGARGGGGGAVGLDVESSGQTVTLSDPAVGSAAGGVNGAGGVGSNAISLENDRASSDDSGRGRKSTSLAALESQSNRTQYMLKGIVVSVYCLWAGR